MHRAQVRLEWRLERQNLIPGEQRSDQELYATEHSIEMLPEQSECVTNVDVCRVLDWLERHRDDSEIGFRDIEKHLGGEKRRSMLVNVLTYLKLGHVHDGTIQRMVNGKDTPEEAKAILRDPFQALRRGG